MPGFHRDNHILLCDGHRLEPIAAELGTPCYVYSAPAIRARYRELDAAFAGHPHAIHYALKANSTLAVVRLLRDLGAHADANSGGEIDVALRAGFAPDEIVFTGVGKTHPEIERAVGLGLKAINAESFGEMDRIDQIARALGTRARVAVRINPDIDAMSHPGISTGRKTNKFGVAIEDARAMCREMATRGGLQVVGLHVHVGSQITKLEPLKRAAESLVQLAAELEGDGVSIEHLDVGGGLGISYDGGDVPTAAEYAAAVMPVIKASGRSLVLEPGRVIVGPAGVLLTRVEYLKHTAVQRRTGRPYFIDKLPNNWLYVPFIRLILPNAKIIDARRHPLSCCLSNFRQHFARGQAFTYSLTDLGNYYADYVRMMAHVDAVLPGAVHRVIYERMVEDTESEVRRLLDYVGVEFEPACLEFWQTERAVRTASSEQVRKPIYKAATEEWKAYEPYLDPLKEALGPALENYA